MPKRIGPKLPFRYYIAEWRESRGLTQEQLAGRLDTTSVTVSRWETGKRRPDLDALAALAEALDCAITDLARHPDTPSADALLRGQPPEVVEQAMKVIRALRR